MKKDIFYLFAYGTLMKDRSNHRYLEEEKFICCTEIKGFGLYDVTEEYPGIIEKKDFKVKGELYEISSELLLVLDDFEGEEYRRVEIEVENKEDTVTAFTYLWLGDTKSEDFVPYEQQPWRKNI